MSGSAMVKRLGRHMGLRGKTVLGLGLMIAIGMVVMGVAVYWHGAGVAEKHAYELVLKQQEDRQDKVEAALEQARDNLITLIGMPPIAAIIRAREAGGVDPLSMDSEEVWKSQLEQIMRAYLENHNIYHSLSYLDAAGNEMLRLDAHQGIERVMEGALQERSERNVFTQAFTLPKGEVYYSDMRLNRESGVITEPHNPLVHLASPVYQRGEVKGVVVLSMEAEPLLNMLDAKRAAIKSRVVNEEGYFLTHSDSSKLFGFDLGHQQTLMQESPGLWRAMQQEDRGAVPDAEEGYTDLFYTFHYDRFSRDRFWTVIYTLPTELVMAEVMERRDAMLVAGGVILLLTLLFISLFVSDKILGPIMVLAEAARRLRQGDLSHRLDTASVRDEFRTLFGSMNDFAESQQQATARLEQKVAERTGQLACIVENLPDGLITMDERGTIESFNPAAVSIFGYQPAEVIGGNINRLMPSPYAEQHDQYLRNHITTGKRKISGRQVELVALHKDGHTFPIELTVNEMVLSDRRLFVGSVRDITERVQAVREIKEKNVALEKANRMKSEFLATMSHELRTPLNAIIGFSEVLKDGVQGKLSDGQQDSIQEVYDSGEHLLGLINEVLDLSKIEAGTMEVELSDEFLPDLLRYTRPFIGEQVSKRRIAFHVKISDAIGVARMDAGKFKQIMSNLLSNAVKFTPEGGKVLLEAAIISADEAEALLHPAVSLDGALRYLKVAVIDSGIGISEADQARIFLPFVQLDSSLARSYAGTGLGLVIVKRLAELLGGGAVLVRSEINVGTTFAVVLPYLEVDEGEA